MSITPLETGTASSMRLALSLLVPCSLIAETISLFSSFEEVGDYEPSDVAVIVPSAATVVTEIIGKIQFASFRRNFLFDLNGCALLATMRTVEAWEGSFSRVWRDESSRFIPP